MPKLHISGAEIVQILIKGFGFSMVRQKGSHVVLRRFESGKKIVTVVPLHPDVKLGTIFGILELGKVDREEFFRKAK